jgi:hypothetical protein
MTVPLSDTPPAKRANGKSIIITRKKLTNFFIFPPPKQTRTSI